MTFSDITTATATSFSCDTEMINLYFLSSELLILTIGLEFLCDVFISCNEIFSLIDLINASFIANFHAKCSYGELNFFTIIYFCIRKNFFIKILVIIYWFFLKSTNINDINTYVKTLIQIFIILYDYRLFN